LTLAEFAELTRSFDWMAKVVAIVDRNNEQTKELLNHIAAENFEVEVCDNYERDVSEDAAVGAYIALASSCLESVGTTRRSRC